MAAALGGLAGNVPKMALVRVPFWAHLMSGLIVPFFRDWGRLSYAQMFAVQA